MISFIITENVFFFRNQNNFLLWNLLILLHFLLYPDKINSLSSNSWHIDSTSYHIQFFEFDNLLEIHELSKMTFFVIFIKLKSRCRNVLLGELQNLLSQSGSKLSQMGTMSKRTTNVTFENCYVRVGTVNRSIKLTLQYKEPCIVPTGVISTQSTKLERFRVLIFLYILFA